MKATAFIELWKDFHNKYIKKNSWEDKYPSSPLWTDFIIGKKTSEECNSPLGDFITSRFQSRYRKEDGLCDLSIVSKSNFTKINSLHEDCSNRINVIPDNTFLPSQYFILIEHENNIYLCYEEMAKLVYQRAQLKILITYNEDSDINDDYEYISDAVISNFSKIISQSNEKLNENIETEYLLLIGQKMSNQLIWPYTIFGTEGIIKQRAEV